VADALDGQSHDKSGGVEWIGVDRIDLGLAQK
jgi:hypothetical protein